MVCLLCPGVHFFVSIGFIPSCCFFLNAIVHGGPLPVKGMPALLVPGFGRCSIKRILTGERTHGPRKCTGKLFRHIRELLPGHVSLADEIAGILDISTDSAYRRIRGEKPISLEELQKLSSRLRFR